ncbi:biotin carboxyl carrier domain-containing protein [Campylobacter hepaticus]|uniref:Biotin carboxyl carrier protein of acetyl-CoA carboxylase n=1 Tax=Campylobacter hepaticus TaxID=1813019 RepID=A0A424YZ13_9BACT|nr:acetyl-CoA carboxylase [Campylobacter hepaticus]RQD68525.1 biotin carboxyl carrier domain-containing protein [Campylobacter hepaticus]RQD86371.1 biotin carboxyl carrier domain-containing protein [Campylobacter hepaticus]
MAQILSPIPGTFYSKVNPDAAPYVEIGTQVDEESVVCLIEVLKTFHEIKAGVKGKIVEIKYKDEDFVNPGDVLFIVEQ